MACHILNVKLFESAIYQALDMAGHVPTEAHFYLPMPNSKFTNRVRAYHAREVEPCPAPLVRL